MQPVTYDSYDIDIRKKGGIKYKCIYIHLRIISNIVYKNDIDNPNKFCD